jgi:ankyrin repeat protein
VLVDSEPISRLLLGAGANVCGRDGRGRNALHLAVRNNSTRALDVILNDGAQDAVQQALNATDYEGRSQSI